MVKTCMTIPIKQLGSVSHFAHWQRAFPEGLVGWLVGFLFVMWSWLKGQALNPGYNSTLLFLIR